MNRRGFLGKTVAGLACLVGLRKRETVGFRLIGVDKAWDHCQDHCSISITGPLPDYDRVAMEAVLREYVEGCRRYLSYNCRC